MKITLEPQQLNNIFRNYFLAAIKITFWPQRLKDYFCNLLMAAGIFF